MKQAILDSLIWEVLQFEHERRDRYVTEYSTNPYSYKPVKIYLLARQYAEVAIDLSLAKIGKLVVCNEM